MSVEGVLLTVALECTVLAVFQPAAVERPDASPSRCTVSAPIPKALLIALADQILASVRCTSATLKDVQVRRLPILPRGNRCRWYPTWAGDHLGICGDEGAVLLERGWLGRTPLAGQVERVLSQLKVLLAPPPNAAVVRAELKSAARRGRTVHRTMGRDSEGAESRVLWTVFYCEDVDQTFLATYSGPPTEDDLPLLERLEGLLCPSRRPAAELLQVSALRTETLHPDPDLDLD